MQIITSESRLTYHLPEPTGSVVTVIGHAVGERRRQVDAKGRVELQGRLPAEADAVMYRT